MVDERQYVELHMYSWEQAVKQDGKLQSFFEPSTLITLEKVFARDIFLTQSIDPRPCISAKPNYPPARLVPSVQTTCKHTQTHTWEE